MAVSEQTPYIEYTANGVTTSFALEFDCDRQDHLIVLVDDVEPVVGAWSFSNGDVVFNAAPENGKKITIQRNTPFSRTTDYQSYNNSFRPPAVNNDFDLVWRKLQELGVADWLLRLYIDRLHGEQKTYIDQKDAQLQNNINDLSAHVDQQDAQLQQNIDNLKTYVDDKDNELRAYLMEEIRKQGVALDQLDDYYNYLMQRLAQIAVDKGWDASFVVDASGKSQQEINDRGGSYWREKPLGYDINSRVMLENGDIVKSTVPNNTVDPNVDMTGWVKVNASSQIFDKSGLSQQKYNDALSIVAPIIESNTWQQNRDIIQAVNDAIFTSNKGGKIQLPNGTFNLKGVVLDSDVTIQGNNTWLVHPDGFDVDMFATRTFSTSGSIAKDSYTLTVADPTGFKVGSLVGIECAGGLNIYQSTTLVNAVDSSQTTGFQFTNKTGFQNYSLGHGLLIVDNEIISYSSLDASGYLGGVVRGLLGSTPAAHSAGAQIGISSRHVTEIINISENTITLLNKAKFSVTSGNVLCGGQRTNVVDINVKGARQNNVGGHRWSPFRMTLHKFGEADYYVENSENGVYLQNSSDNDINIRAKDVSKTGTGKIGAAIWCYQGSNNNKLNLKQVGDCWCGVVIDDRSNIATEWIAECTGNYGTITGNFNNYDIVTPLNSTLLNIAACGGNTFKVKAYNIYSPVFVSDDGQGISAVGAFRKAECNEIDVYTETCVNPVSASLVKNNTFKVVSRYAENPKPLIGNGNVLIVSNYQSTSGMGFRALDGGYASPSYSFLNQTTTGMSLDVSGNLALYKEGIPVVTYGANQVVIWRDGSVINTGSATGTKIGVSSIQKIGFYGSTPIIKPISTPAAATDPATTQALVNSIRESLINLGLIG